MHSFLVCDQSPRKRFSSVCVCVCMKHREGADVGETMTGLLLLHPFPVAL